MFWKVHFFVYAIVEVLAMMTIIAGDSEKYAWDTVASHLLGIVSLIPLYGNAFGKALGFRAVWVSITLVMLIVNVVIPVTEMLRNIDRLSWDHSRWTLILAEFYYLLLTLYFVGVIRYVLLRPKLWQNNRSVSALIS